MFAGFPLSPGKSMFVITHNKMSWFTFIVAGGMSELQNHHEISMKSNKR
jgi:hypothetical protein